MLSHTGTENHDRKDEDDLSICEDNEEYHDAADHLSEIEDSSFQHFKEGIQDSMKTILRAGEAILNQPLANVDIDVRELVSPLAVEIQRSRAVVKLEQMSHFSLLFSLFLLYFSCLLCSIAALVVAVTSSQVEHDVSLEVTNFMLAVEGFCRTLAVLLMVFLLVFFPCRIFLHGSSPQQEQLWLIAFIVLLMVSPGMSVYSPIFYWNQFTKAQTLGPQLFHNNSLNFTLSQSVLASFYGDSSVEVSGAYVFSSICTVLVMSFGMLYFGSTVNSFSQPKMNRSCECRNTTQLCLLFLSISYSFIFIPLILHFDFLPSQVPLVGMISVLKTCTAPNGLCHPEYYNGIGFQRSLVVTAQFLFELAVLFYLHFISRKTKRKLDALSYETHRANVLGFRFFNGNKRTMSFFIFLSSVLITSCSTSAQDSLSVVSNNGSTSILINPLRQVGITFFTLGFGSVYLLLASFLFAFAYAYLPPDEEKHIGLSAFLCCCSLRHRKDHNRQKEHHQNLPAPTYLLKVSDVETYRQVKLEESKRLQQNNLPASSLWFVPGVLLQKIVNSNSAVHNEVSIENTNTTSSIANFQVNGNFLCMQTEVLLLNFSYMAYKKDGIQKYLPANFQEVKWIENLETHIACRVVEDPITNEIIVSFRGSSSMKNVKQDLDYMQMNHDMCPSEVDPLFDHLDCFQAARARKQSVMVHRGFFNAYLSIREELLQILPTYIKDDSVVYCCGHSLGGALATFLAVDVALFFQKNKLKGGVHLSSFGCPRVGNFAFTSRVRKLVPTIHRFCVGGDPVPKLPPSQYFGSLTHFGYRHVGTEILLDVSKSNMLIDPSFIEKQIHHSWRGYVLSNHLMGSYVLGLAYFVARTNPAFSPDWWLPVVKFVRRSENKRLKRMSNTHPHINVMTQLDQGGTLFFDPKAGGVFYQNQGCDTAAHETNVAVV